MRCEQQGQRLAFVWADARNVVVSGKVSGLSSFSVLRVVRSQMTRSVACPRVMRCVLRVMCRVMRL